MTPEESSNIDTELLLKIITRTDSYLNYANTKSTIIVTFITAIIAAIGAHSGDAIHYLYIKNYPALAIFFKILILIGLLLLVTGFYHAGKSVMPYTRPSVKKNFFSFIDTIHHYPSEDAYSKVIQNMGGMIWLSPWFHFSITYLLVLLRNMKCTGKRYIQFCFPLSHYWYVSSFYYLSRENNEE